MERLDIDTPESVVFGYQVAGIGSRFMAALADNLVLIALFLAFSCGLSTIPGTGSFLDSLVSALSLVLLFFLIWGYPIFFEMIWNGQTPGKRWAGLRVVQTDGTPISFFDSLIRNLVRVVDFLPMFYAIGLVSMFFSEQSRRLGDYAAGTLVIKEQRDVTLQQVQAAARTTASLPGTAAPSLDLSEDDYQLITDFLRRRYELRNRGVLAQRIATAIAAKLGLPQPTSMREAEDLLVRLARRPRR